MRQYIHGKQSWVVAVRCEYGYQMDYYKSRTFPRKKQAFQQKKPDILKIGF
jgi:hypothetical protein